jgi:CelD/BcsL family acetyltransferase involved in cellulose biosynthesis
MIFYGKKLFSISAPMCVLATHFTNLSDDPDALPLPLDTHPEASGALINSHPIKHDLPRLAFTRNLVRFVPAHYNRYLIDVNGSFADYMKKFTSKTRNKLKRYIKWFAEAGNGKPHYRLFRKPDEMLEFHALASDIAAKTYQARLIGNQLPATDEFRDGMVARAARGDAWGALLYHDGKAAAFWYFTHDGTICVSEFTGFDTQYRELSPGTALICLTLEKIFDEKRFSLFDFGEGEADYKEMFSTRSQRCAEVFYLRPSARNLSIVSMDTALWGTRRLLRPLEEELTKRGIKARLKRLIRKSS